MSKTDYVSNNVYCLFLKLGNQVGNGRLHYDVTKQRKQLWNRNPG